MRSSSRSKPLSGELRSYHVLYAVAVLIAAVGLNVFSWGIWAVKNRKRVIAQFTEEEYGPFPQKFLFIWTMSTFMAGASMIVGAMLLPSAPAVGLLLALWPPVGFTLFVRQKRPKH